MKNSHIRATSRIGKVLLSAGILAIGVWSWSVLRMTTYQSWEERAFEREIHGRSVPPERKKILSSEPTGSSRAPGNPPAASRAIVGEGVDANTLGWALGHIPGTAFPGQNGGN